MKNNKKKNKNKKDVNCSYISNEGNAEWNETPSTFQQVVKGNCIQGYQGTISRTCIQSGSIGNWTSIIGSCNGIFSLFESIFLFPKRKKKKSNQIKSNQ